VIAVVPLLICLFGIGECPNGDLGRLKPGLVTDNIHSWVGQTAARDNYREPSNYPLTDDERQLRDLAYPLIEPPFDRGRFYSIVNEYGVSNLFTGWPHYDRLAYAKNLMVTPYRSATARYSQLDTDIRNDVTRISPFFMTARRVLDMDDKRAKSLGYVDVNASERANAVARNAENILIVEWVQQSLLDRAEAYRAALERLVIATPAPMAVETERSLTLLRMRIAESQIAVGRAPGSGIVPVGARPLITK
jgi:hypothetical protein